MQTNLPSVAFLGLGAMGSRMARKLLDAGFRITLYNRTLQSDYPEQFPKATFASTPLEAVRDADFVVSMLTDDQASEAVWLDPAIGALAGMKPGAIGIECSTLSVGWMEILSQTFASHSLDFVEAPVIGSLIQAESGQLIVLAGGPAEVVERAAPLLKTLSTRMMQVGEYGRATFCKLIVNAYFASQVASLAELIHGAGQNGLSRESLAEILSDLPVLSPALKGVLGQIVSQDFTPFFPIRLVAKDLGYLEETLHFAESESPISATSARFAKALAAGLGNLNISGVIEASMRNHL